MSKEPTCYGCEHLKDIFGNYVECMLYAEKNPLSHMFVDYWYWGHGAPDTCPLKTTSKKDTTMNEIRKMIQFLHNKGIDGNGAESLKEQIPYWTEFLDKEYGAHGYASSLAFVKGIGYRVFRNSQGKHKIVYEDGFTEI